MIASEQEKNEEKRFIYSLRPNQMFHDTPELLQTCGCLFLFTQQSSPLNSMIEMKTSAFDSCSVHCCDASHFWEIRFGHFPVGVRLAVGNSSEKWLIDELRLKSRHCCFAFI